MTSSLDLLDAVHAALTGTTDAGALVFRPGDWPSQPNTLPQLKLRILSESRQSIARSGAPEFITTTTIRIVGEVQARATEDDLGATEAEGLLWSLKRQVEVAIVNSYPLTGLIQQIASMQSQIAFNAEGAVHLAGVQIDLALEFYEGPESFAPVASSDLTQIHLVATAYPPAATDVPLT